MAAADTCMDTTSDNPSPRHVVGDVRVGDVRVGDVCVCVCGGRTLVHST